MESQVSWSLDAVEQPRDARGRFASFGLAGDGIHEAADALEEALDSGPSAYISEASARLLAVIGRVPRLSPAEAERIRDLLKMRGAEAIPTEHWHDLKRGCDNSSASAQQERSTINEVRLKRRGARRAIQGS